MVKVKKILIALVGAVLAAGIFLSPSFVLPAAPVSAAQQAPVIHMATDGVKGGDLISLQGEFFGDGTEVIAAPVSTAPDIGDLSAFPLYIVQRDLRNGQYLVAHMPAGRQGVFDLWVRTANGTSAPYRLNGPRPFFLSEFEAWAGQIIDISGRNFDWSEFSGFSVTPSVRLTPVAGGTSHTVQPLEFNQTRIRFAAPDIPTGEYVLEVSTTAGVWVDFSGRQTLSRPQTLTIVAGNNAQNDPYGIGSAWARHIDWNNRIDISSQGTVSSHPGMSSVNSHNTTVQNAINTAGNAGGGVVVLGAGDHWLSDIRMRDRVAVVGVGRMQTRIRFGSQSTGNAINEFITHNRTDSPTNTNFGANGLANLSILNNYDPTGPDCPDNLTGIYSQPDFAPDVYVNLGDWLGGHGNALDYQNAGYFLVDVDIKSGMTRAVHHSDGFFYQRAGTRVNYNPDYETDVGHDRTPQHQFHHTTSGGWVLGHEPARQRGRAFGITGGRSVIRNVVTQTFSGPGLQRGVFSRVEDSSITYANMQFNILTCFSFILNSEAHGMRERNNPRNMASQHGFMSRGNIHFENNIITGMGAYANDGEVIGLEVPAANYGFGRFTAVTANSVTFEENADIHWAVNRNYEFSSLAVMITYGRGRGQMRFVERPVIGSQTVQLSPGQEPWAVMPDSTSIGSLVLPIENSTLYNNEGRDCAKGLLFFGNTFDAATINNTLIDTDGIMIWGVAADLWSHRQAENPANSFIDITGNTMTGYSYRTQNSTIALTTGRNTGVFRPHTCANCEELNNTVAACAPNACYGGFGGLFMGTQIYGVNIRRNAVEGIPNNINPITSQSESPSWRTAISISSAFHSSHFAADRHPGDVANVVIQHNDFVQTFRGVHHSNNNDGILLMNNTFTDSRQDSSMTHEVIRHRNIHVHTAAHLGRPYGRYDWGADNVNFLEWAAPAATTFTVNFDSQGGSPVAPQTGIASGTTATRPSPNPTRAGFTFNDWFLGNTPFNFASPITDNIVLTARWNAIPYTITYILNGGQNAAGNPAGFNFESSAINLLDPTRDQFVFDGWFDNPEFTGNKITVIPAGSTGNRQLYAKWTPADEATFTIKWNTNGGVNNGLNLPSYTTASGTIVLHAPTKTGFNFAGWYTDAAFGGDAVISFAAAEGGNREFFAKWDLRRFSINYVLMGGVNHANNPTGFDIESEDITLLAPTRTGFVFVGWFDNEGLTGTPVTVIAAGSVGDRLLFASWQRDQSSTGNNNDNGCRDFLPGGCTILSISSLLSMLGFVFGFGILFITFIKPQGRM